MLTKLHENKENKKLFPKTKVGGFCDSYRAKICFFSKSQMGFGYWPEVKLNSFVLKCWECIPIVSSIHFPQSRVSVLPHVWWWVSDHQLTWSQHFPLLHISLYFADCSACRSGSEAFYHHLSKLWPAVYYCALRLIISEPFQNTEDMLRQMWSTNTFQSSS